MESVGCSAGTVSATATARRRSSGRGSSPRGKRRSMALSSSTVRSTGSHVSELPRASPSPRDSSARTSSHSRPSNRNATSVSSGQSAAVGLASSGV